MGVTQPSSSELGSTTIYSTDETVDSINKQNSFVLNKFFFGLEVEPETTTPKKQPQRNPCLGLGENMIASYTLTAQRSKAT